MRVRELGIENFRKFRQPIRLTGFDDGLNLVCEANETGKSTVLEALRAVLFERHGSHSDRIKSFRPQGDEVAPTVDLVFDIAGETWRLRKRFLQKPEVVLEGPSEKAAGDEAEEKLQALLGFTRAGNRGADADTRGALGLLWVEQGLSHVLSAPGQAARRTLEDVLAGEVGAVTGGRRTTFVTEAVEKNLAELLTATGKPTKRLAEAQQGMDAAVSEAEQARLELEQFEAVLDRLEAKRSESRRLMRDMVDPEEEALARTLAADIERAKAAGQTLRTAEVVLREAVGARARLEAHASVRAAQLEALTSSEQALALVRSAHQAHADSLAAARERERVAANALDKARGALRSAEAARKASEAVRAADDRRGRLGTAFARLDLAEQIGKDLASAEAALAKGTMTESAADRLQALEQAVMEARSAATAGAAVLRVTLTAGAPPVRLNGALIERSAEAAVTESQAVVIEGVGSLIVEPPMGSEAAQAALRAAEQDLAAFLFDVGYGASTEARAAARARLQTEQAVQGLAARLKDACPADPDLGIDAGLDALRGALATEPRPDAAVSNTGPSGPAGDPQAAWESAQETERETEGRRQAALETLQTAELEEVRLAGLVDRAAADRMRLADDVASDLAILPNADLAALLTEAQSIEARALVDRDEARRAAEGLDEVSLVRKRDALTQKRERMRDDRLGLVEEIAKLEERAKTLGGAGPASRASAATEAAEAARIAHARISEEAEVLRLLDRVIKEAQREASRRYLAPVTQRVAPYVTRLLPNSSLAFGDDYSPRSLRRGDREESAENLSKGTQEQLAVLTRIAFADMLIEKGKPASLVLDDALVFADDDRFETMLEILAEAALRMQVIVLSCRTSAYRAIDAKRIIIG